MSAYIRRSVLLLCCLGAFACDRPGESPKSSPPPSPGPPPMPPLVETFDQEPQLSLFPRIGDYRPEDTDTEGLRFWRTYLDHLSRVSGIVDLPVPLGRGRAFALRSIGGLESVAFFSPVAVDPAATYRVSAVLRTDLPAGAAAGIGILEFDEFLWVDQQYPRSLAERHQTGAREGIRVTGKNEWREVGFEFAAGPKTRMVHLVLFREGAEDRAPVLFDDLRFIGAE